MKAFVRARLILPLFVILCLCASDSVAQQLSLSGTVRDSSGVVPGATVTVSSAGTRVAMTTTDQSGNYRFAELPAGSFELSVSLRGYETVTRNVVVGPDTPAVDWNRSTFITRGGRRRIRRKSWAVSPAPAPTTCCSATNITATSTGRT